MIITTIHKIITIQIMLSIVKHVNKFFFSFPFWTIIMMLHVSLTFYFHIQWMSKEITKISKRQPSEREKRSFRFVTFCTRLAAGEKTEKIDFSIRQSGAKSEMMMGKFTCFLWSDMKNVCFQLKMLNRKKIFRVSKKEFKFDFPSILSWSCWGWKFSFHKDSSSSPSP